MTVCRLGPPGTPTHDAAANLLARFGLRLTPVADGSTIPGSFWGDDEAGLLGMEVHARADTPLHSLLHEACDAVCMDSARRATLDTDAGGDDLEECAVCWLSVVLADAIPGFGRGHMLVDMDAWGYSFRLGNARAWFLEDAADARAWLLRHGLINRTGEPTFTLRG
jgi:hypothetical protein